MWLTAVSIQLHDVSTGTANIGVGTQGGGTRPCSVTGLAARCALAKVGPPQGSW